MLGLSGHLVSQNQSVAGPVRDVVSIDNAGHVRGILHKHKDICATICGHKHINRKTKIFCSKSHEIKYTSVINTKKLNIRGGGLYLLNSLCVKSDGILTWSRIRSCGQMSHLHSASHLHTYVSQ